MVNSGDIDDNTRSGSADCREPKVERTVDEAEDGRERNPVRKMTQEDMETG